MAPLAHESRRGPPVLVAVLCGGLGLLAGFTFGHTRCLHESVSPAGVGGARLVVPSATWADVAGCDAVREAAASAMTLLDGALERIAALEYALEAETVAAAATAATTVKRPLTTTTTTTRTPHLAEAAAAAVSKEEVSEEEVEHVAELEARIEALTEALSREQERPDASSAAASIFGGDGGSEGWKRTTPWRSIRGVHAEALWNYGLAGFPYPPTASLWRDALLLTKKSATHGGATTTTKAAGLWDDGECDEVDVITVSAKPGVCVALFDSRLPMYSVLRVDATRGRLFEEERRRVNPQRYVPTDDAAYSEEKLAQRAVLVRGQDFMPKKHSMVEALEATATFGAQTPRLLRKVKETIVRRRVGDRHMTVVVMATNSGTIDLVANFACSAQAAALVAALASVLVFTTDATTAETVERIGLATFHDPALGNLPVEAASVYGDFSFVRMMWLKVTSVFLTIHAGYNVLFQDADIVWLRDPFDYFFSPSADRNVDAYFQDDGARSQRYTPLYTNSGFYLLRSNDRTLYFTYRLLMSYDMVLTVRSHQHALIMLLLEHVSKYAMTVSLLSPRDFPQGHVFHHRKAQMQAYVDGTDSPWMFHMCWTASRIQKLRYLKNLGLWFLTPDCVDNCTYGPEYCLDTKPFAVPTPYTDAIKLDSKLNPEDTYKRPPPVSRATRPALARTTR